MKIAIFLILSVICGLLCIAQATPEQKRDVGSMKDLIKEIKAESVNAQEQDGDNSDDEMDKVFAQLFMKVMKKQAKAEGYGDVDELAKSEGFWDRIRHFFRRARTKLRNFGHKVRRFFHRKG